MLSVSELFQQHQTTLSFEFFPPKTEKGAENLFAAIAALRTLQPSFVSVTYGAGGSTRELTHDLVVKIQQDLQICVVSHLTCVGATRAELGDVLANYHASGIRNIMALRGDPPQGKTYFEVTPGGFEHAAELVAFIKKEFPDMTVGAAGFPEGHPGTPNRLREMDYLKAKVDAGVDYLCTQFFFDNRDFYDFRERCLLRGIHVPMVAGLMPVTSRKSLEKMAECAGGARFPAGLLKSINRAGDSEENVRNVGIQWVTEQVRGLLDRGVSGLHFYTLNKAEDVLEICRYTGIQNVHSLTR